MKKVKQYFQENPPTLELLKKLLDKHLQVNSAESFQYVYTCGTLLFNLKEYKPKKPVSKPVVKTDFTYQDFLQLFNEITKRSFTGTSKSQLQFNARIKDYKKEDFVKAINNALICLSKDYVHYLTPEYITRDNKFVTYLNYKSDKTGGEESDFDK